MTDVPHETDVLVIGAGLAGLHYCLQLIKQYPTVRIVLVSKAPLGECNSRYAQGGIAAALSPTDSYESHIEDTIKAGDGLCYEAAVNCFVRQAPQAVQSLVDYDVNFNKDEAGHYSLHQEGGHTCRRILNTGDKTGLSMITALLAQLSQSPQITQLTHHIAVNLIAQYHPHRPDNQGEILGAYLLDYDAHKIHTVRARCVVLATGGAGKTYRYTTNSMVSTGDGVAMAYRAGARVGNMEFYQFHPTLLHHHTEHHLLISEAVRGEGARLLHPATCERFMKKYAPESMELATRDIVSRAIFREIEQSDFGYVHLDITHQSRAFLQKRFPQIYATLLSLGIDMSQDPIPVVPAAHYQCGGVLTDVDGRTDLARLYAIGEVAFTGLHGANRLASNSLLEAVAMANNAVHSTLKDILTPYRLIKDIPDWTLPEGVNPRQASQINAHWLGLRSEMTSYAGIIRTESGLQDVLQLILKRKAIIEAYYWQHHITRDFIELRNIVLNAELIVRAALARRESRGVHYREDFTAKAAFAEESIARGFMPQHPLV